MSRFVRPTIIVLGLLLLQAPGASGCAGGAGLMAADCPMGEGATGEPVAASMPDDCPMGDTMSGQEHVPARSDGATCPDCGGSGDDCCDVGASPEPMEARTTGGIPVTTALVAAEAPRSATPSPAWRPLETVAPDVPWLHQRGLYTLFSSLLL